MTLPTDSQWARYSVLCAQLQPLPPAARQAQLAAWQASRTEDPQVLSLLAFHYALPPDPDRDRTGERLGPFTLEEPLGAGGMGVVYRAQQQIGSAQRPVAVKLIHPALLRTAREEALARFQAEMSALVKLEHESIARIYDGGIGEDPHTHEPLPYIAMEYVRDGRPLTTYAQDAALAWPERLQLVLRVCRAVQYAHEHGIVHRDLKPANILVDREGRPFVIDFGLAAACDALLPGGHQASGTPAYMSPEQVSATWGAVSAKSDVYALGLILYELLTEQLPYALPPQGAWEQLCDVITTAIPLPLGQYRPEYQGEVEALVAHALAKRPADRCAVAVLRARLERCVQAQPVRRARVEGERKQVTVLCATMQGETSLVETLGEEGVYDLLNQVYARLIPAVQQEGGTVQDLTGDGMLALFGAPSAVENAPLHACRAALTMQAQLRAVGGEVAATHGVRLTARIGLHTGPVVVGTVGTDRRLEYKAVGDTVHGAARLAALATPGSIWLSEATARLVEGYVQSPCVGERTVPGMRGPQRVYGLEGLSDGLARFDLARQRGLTPLVGRERELALLSASLATVRQGRGGVVVLQGEPGIGKSRLVADVRHQSRPERLLWLEGRALSFGRSLSYWPFIEILKGWCGIVETDTEAQAWRKLEQAIRALFGARTPELVPYLGTVLALEIPGEYQQRVHYLDAQALGRQVFLSIHQLFAQLARRQPLLVVLEDWHWVDASSVALCEHLLPLASRLGVLFWFVTRADPADSTARIRAAAARHPSMPFQEIALVALGEDDSRQLLDTLVGPLPEAVRSQILTKTEGNPFFVEEVVRALIAEGRLVKDTRAGAWRLARPGVALGLPDTIQEVIAARLDRLEDGVKRVVKLAAVIGRSFFLRILQAIAEAGDAVDSGLTQLEHAELIRLRQQLPEVEYIFKHALVQEAAYGSILAERRRVIHGSVAAAIERLFAERLEEFASLLAHHYALAEDWEKAQVYLFKAGDQAGRMAADAEALEHYRQAEAAYARVAAQELTPLQRAILDRKLGQAFYGVGNYGQAIEHGTRALAHLGIAYPRTRWGVRRSLVYFLAVHFLRWVVRGTGHAHRPTMEVATAQEISMICRLLVWLDYFSDEERSALDGLIDLYAGERSGDVLGRVRGHSALAIMLMTLRAFAPARRHLAEADTIGQRSAEPAATATTALVRGWLGLVTGSLDAGFDALQQSAATFHRIGDIRGWGGASFLVCWILYVRAACAAIAPLASAMLRIGQDAGDPFVTSWGQVGLGLRALLAGPLDEAATHLAAVYDVTGRISSFRMQATVGGLLVKCRLRQGRLAEAAGILHEALGLIKAKHLRGEWSADPLNAFAALCLIEADRLSGAPQRQALRTARRACAQALRYTQDAAPWLPETLRLQGTLLWLAGHTTSAERHWQRSLATAEHLSLALERARTLLEMGIRRNDAGLVDEATGVFVQTGARVDLACSLHARARMTSESGADVGVTLQCYDQAIAVLAEVKGEYALGAACRQRARLHKQVGRVDLARADLAQAQRCFAAVGATVEQAEVEQEAVTLGERDRNALYSNARRSIIQ
jgi:class 3 adenylate cyclase/tetratricopeptide (TPR) repeat protein